MSFDIKRNPDEWTQCCLQRSIFLLSYWIRPLRTRVIFYLEEEKKNTILIYSQAKNFSKYLTPKENLPVFETVFKYRLRQRLSLIRERKWSQHRWSDRKLSSPRLPFDLSLCVPDAVKCKQALMFFELFVFFCLLLLNWVRKDLFGLEQELYF